MTEIAELTTSDTMKLPEEVAARFQPSDRFMVWAEGDTLYLKRIMPRSVTNIVAEAPLSEPMSPDEISDLVHQVLDSGENENLNMGRLLSRIGKSLSTGSNRRSSHAHSNCTQL